MATHTIHSKSWSVWLLFVYIARLNYLMCFFQDVYVDFIEDMSKKQNMVDSFAEMNFAWLKRIQIELNFKDKEVKEEEKWYKSKRKSCSSATITRTYLPDLQSSENPEPVVMEHNNNADDILDTSTLERDLIELRTEKHQSQKYAMQMSEVNEFKRKWRENIKIQKLTQ